MTSNISHDAITAKVAARSLVSTDTATKNQALERAAVALQNASEELIAANQSDIETANAQVSAGLLQESALSRLTLTREKIAQMVRSIRNVAALDDPVGKILLRRELDDDLELKKITCPFGVIAAIVEARPDAVVQLAALALKSGNALMIKAGAEVSATAKLIVETLQDALSSDGRILREVITNVTSREQVHEILQLSEYIDLVVPRGSAELIRFVSQNTRIPVLGHADGVCHIYVDSAADQEMAISVILDSKTQAPSTCNAVETLLVDRPIAIDFLPKLIDALRLHGVKARGCAITTLLCGQSIDLVDEGGWHTEYGCLTLAIRMVDGCGAAIDHINHFGSHHTDCIITEDANTAESFLREVDSAGVFHNVSTRFSDGHRYGFGAEVGISTGKLHARGPVGLESLVTYKYLISGNGHRVRDYVGEDARRFKHELRSMAVEVSLRKSPVPASPPWPG
jgi:glutamate-5-semialdehyde dehydrogenase